MVLRRDRKPRGFGFVQFLDEQDAEDAMNALDGKVWGGREITVRPPVHRVAPGMLRHCSPHLMPHLLGCAFYTVHFLKHQPV